MKESIKTIWSFDRAIKSLHNSTMKEGENMVREVQEMRSSLESECDNLLHQTGKLLDQTQKVSEQQQQFISTIKVEQDQRLGKEGPEISPDNTAAYNEPTTTNIPTPRPPTPS